VLPNDASLALHKRFGFQQVAHYTEQGRKFEKFWDVVFLERAL
jgi:phosphinothricin acetyltransferase